jgi:hypothetical protein
MNLSIARKRLNRRQRRSRAGLVFLLLLSLSLITCGLPAEPFLYPPENETLATESTRLLFRNPEDNNPEVFRGFLIFYRFYISSSAPTVDEIADSGESYLTTFNLSNYDIANERGVYGEYSLLRYIEVPLGDRTTDFVTMLDFGTIATIGGKGEAPRDVGTIYDEQPLRRTYKRGGIWQDGMDAEAFSLINTTYEAGNDTDLPSGFTGSEDMICAVWAVCYGFDVYDSFQNVYSEAEYIGQFDITL